MPRKILLSWLLLVIGCHAADKTQPAYGISQQFDLSQRQNGMDGKIELWMDVRLTPSVRERLWGKGDWSVVLPPESELFKEFTALPPGNAKLRLKDQSGKIVVERNLDRPLAELKECIPSGGGKAGYLLTLDDSAGFGSYNGLGTAVLQVANARLNEAGATNVSTRQQETIRLAKTLKSDWRIQSGGQGTEILSLSSHPGSDGSFVSDYVRYWFDGSQWLESKRQEAGLWESDRPFPPRSAFP
jgi:hypothetical protein